MKIKKPGLYVNLSIDDYERDPCPQPSLRSTVARLLITRTPAHAQAASPRLNPDWKEDRSKEMDLGSVAHKMLLGAGREVRVIRAPDYKGGAAKIARDQSYRTGKLPILHHHFEAVRRMVAAANRQIVTHQDWPTSFQPKHGKAEVTLIWQEKIGPRHFVWCRVRLDWLPNKWATDPHVGFVDYKSTWASAGDQWANMFWRDALDFRHAFYRRAIVKALGVNYYPRVVYCVQEVTPPHALMFHEPDQEAGKDADEKVEVAIQMYGHCLKTGNWPGYPNSTNYITQRPWDAQRWEALKQFIGEKVTPALLQRMIQMQAPLDQGKKS